MSKGLVSLPEHQRVAVATRRLVGNTRGIAFWAAKDFFDKKKTKYPVGSEIGRAQVVNTLAGRMDYDEKRSVPRGDGNKPFRGKVSGNKNIKPTGKDRKSDHRKKQRTATLSAVWPKHGAYGSSSISRPKTAHKKTSTGGPSRDGSRPSYGKRPHSSNGSSNSRPATVFSSKDRPRSFQMGIQNSERRNMRAAVSR